MFRLEKKENKKNVMKSLFKSDEDHGYRVGTRDDPKNTECMSHQWTPVLVKSQQLLNVPPWPK